ncbi:MAG: NAD(P)-dependent alcohol dehydrogenase [Anaerolineae bacterium]|nr:NAD(P)-dependent alcohol dehydrogenase [Anaerolineae bacterium]
MKAVIYERYGPPEVLQIKEVAKPVPKDNEVLIKIHATTVSIEDSDIRRAPFGGGSGKPRNPILGTLLAGEIEAVGRSVRRFAPGDQVYGFTGFFGAQGTYAEYTCMRGSGCLAIKPANMTYEEAAAIPDGGLTSLPFVRNVGKVRPGQKVLVNGASGAVGSAGVQLAKYFGAEVTGVCSTANLELVKSLGADQVIDYTQEDFTQNGQTYDVIYDAVGKSSFSKCRDTLTPRGVYMTTVPMPGDMLHMLRTLIGWGRRVRFAATGLMRPARKRKDLEFLTKLAEAGEIMAVIDRVYPLEEIVEAHRYVDTGRKKGNVVITIEHDDLADRSEKK